MIKSTDDRLRQRSHRLIDKFRKIKLHAKSSKRDEQKLNDSYKNTSDPSKRVLNSSLHRQSTLSSSIDLGTILHVEAQLKGILKTPAKTSSCSDLVNDVSNSQDNFQRSKSSVEPGRGTVSREISDELISSGNNYNNQFSTSSSSKSAKHVTFDDKISQTHYKSDRHRFHFARLSHHHARRLKKFHRKNSLTLDPAYITNTYLFDDEDPIDTLEFQRIGPWESSGNESDEDI